MEDLKTPVDNLRIAAEMEREIHQAIKRDEDADDYLGTLKKVYDASVYLAAAENADPNLTYGEDQDFISVKTIGAFLCAHHAYIDAQHAQRRIWGGVRQTNKDVVKMLESALEAARKSAAYHPTPFAYLKAAEILTLLYRRDDAIQVLKNGIEKCPDNIDLKREYDTFRFDDKKGVKKTGTERLKRPLIVIGGILGFLIVGMAAGPVAGGLVLIGCIIYLFFTKEP